MVAVALALCVLLSGRALVVSGQELVSLQIAFRHGDRSPIDIFPRHIQDWVRDCSAFVMHLKKRFTINAQK